MKPLRSIPQSLGRLPRAARWTGLIIAAFALGYLLRGGGPQPPAGTSAEATHDAHAQAAIASVWTCSMHPQIRQPEAGRCPICGMDLIPVEEPPTAAHGAADLTLSEYARQLAGVAVAPVERRFVETEIRMVGKIGYDETRLAYITARVPGRLDRLFVDYTGVPVRKGDHLVSLYSPELLSAQQELIQAARAARSADERTAGSGPVATAGARLLLEATREKLRLWGLTAEQVSEIERSRVASDHLTIYAPLAGIVIGKDAVEGMYVQTGTRIYTIADLSHLWVRLDAYESDLTWLRYGQEVRFDVVAYPGETFSGRIAFIDPVLDARTRTVKVRVNVPNQDGRLKPEMFLHATVRSRVTADGRVMEPDLVGKWICPMHPEVVAETSGDCEICGMPLARSESLGYVSAGAGNAEAPLVIPASAPLITGQRAVVYIERPDAPGTYEGREIRLGPRAGDHYIVSEGLDEGELVVVSGSFKIDSAVQILARPSMMNPAGAAPSSAQQHAVPVAFGRDLALLLEHYFEIHRGLSLDSLAVARSAARRFAAKLEVVAAASLEEPARSLWTRERPALVAGAASVASTTTIQEAREQFEPLSAAMITLTERLAKDAGTSVLRFHCPMAFDGRGADWLQDHAGVENPYYGAIMYRCGTQTGILAEPQSASGSER